MLAFSKMYIRANTTIDCATMVSMVIENLIQVAHNVSSGLPQIAKYDETVRYLREKVKAMDVQGS
jgi:hypothetical protein